jgi:hypothetical protein
MDRTKTALERAFELAQSGKCLNVTEVEKRLKSERFDPSQIEGPSLRKQLLKLIEEARHAL